MSESSAISITIVDSEMYPHFVGTPEEAAKWIDDNVPENSEVYRVCIGSSKYLTSISEFLEGVRQRRDSIIRVRRQKVMELVSEAMIKQLHHGKASGMESVGVEITDKIMALFE